MSDEDFLEFGMLHSSVCTPGRTRLNPYHVGLKIFEDIEKRFDLAKAFEIREMENDVSLIHSYLTEELVEDLDLFASKLEEDKWKITDKKWEKVGDAICESVTNFGQPYIVVEDGDYHDERELDFPYAERTLKYVYDLWGHPVHLETVDDGKPLLFTCEQGGTVTRAYL